MTKRIAIKIIKRTYLDSDHKRSIRKDQLRRAQDRLPWYSYELSLNAVAVVGAMTAKNIKEISNIEHLSKIFYAFMRLGKGKPAKLKLPYNYGLN